jgi:uncharacterized membrane protein (UPF0127 family)
MPKFLIPFYFFLGLSVILSSGCSQKVFRKVCIRDLCVRAEVADTPLVRQNGLMYRDNLGPKEGMLFIFEREGKHNFWMKNMRIPLDIIWLSADKRIVHIVSNAQPCRENCYVLGAGEASKYVLEVNAEFAVKHRLKTGDVLEF